MDLAREIDIYCERVSAAFWAEPFNALTNVAFILAGIAALWLQGQRGPAGTGRQLLAGTLMAAGIIAFFAHTIGLLWAISAGPLYLPLVVPVYVLSVVFVAAGLLAQPAAWAAPAPNWPVAWLSGNAIVVGIGSFLFHSYATPWAGLADTGPIMMFIFGTFAIVMNRFVGLRWRTAALATVAFVAGMVVMSAGLRQVLNEAVLGAYAEFANSKSYYPALLALFATGLWLHLARAHPAGGVMMRAGGIFAISLVFRTLDGPLCPWLPIGTHWLWHLFNALVFWVILSGLVRYGRAPAPVSAGLGTR
ncbi:MAG: hypothetical protein ACFBRM_03735 [Pikeienuella sp.]